MGAGCPLGDRIQPLLRRRDPGFPFALLCNYAKAPGTTKLDEWLESILQAAGKFGLTELKTEWKKELRASVVIGEPKGLADHLKALWLNRGPVPCPSYRVRRQVGYLSASQLARRSHHEDGRVL